MFSIKVAPTRYVQYCGNGILETTDANLKIFSEEECKRIIEELKQRYIYQVILEDEKQNINVVDSVEKMKVAETDAYHEAIAFEEDECFELQERMVGKINKISDYFFVYLIYFFILQDNSKKN